MVDHILGLYLTALACSSISMLGSGFICWMFLRHKSLQSFPYVLVFFLAVSDFLNAIALAIPGQLSESEPVCLAQAVILGFSSLSSLLWTGSIPYALWLIMAKEPSTHRSFVKTAAISFSLLSVAAAVTPLSLDLCGPSGLWCGIEEKSLLSQMMLIATYYMFVVIVFVESTVMCWLTISILKREPMTGDSRKYVFRKLILFPMVTLIAVTPLISLRVIELFHATIPHPLRYIAVALYSLWGAMNAIVYGITRNVRQILRGRCSLDEGRDVLLDDPESGKL